MRMTKAELIEALKDYPDDMEIKRREMMQWWGDYLGALSSNGQVIFGKFKTGS